MIIENKNRPLLSQVFKTQSGLKVINVYKASCLKAYDVKKENMIFVFFKRQLSHLNMRMWKYDSDITYTLRKQ